MVEEEVDPNQEQYKKLHFRMYESKYPKENELVFVSKNLIKYLKKQCKIVEIVEIGAYVSLLEYDNIRGMLFSGEITLKRVNFLNRLLSVGKEEVLRVLRVDTQKGFIDLSKKQVKPDEIEECKQKYGKSKAVEGIVKKLAVNTKKSMEYLYKNIIWPLYKSHGHAYDALKSLLNGDEHILEGLKITDEIKENWRAYVGQVCEITGMEVMNTGGIRHPKFVQWRADKDKTECTWERIFDK